MSAVAQPIAYMSYNAAYCGVCGLALVVMLGTADFSLRTMHYEHPTDGHCLHSGKKFKMPTMQLEELPR